MKETNQLIEIGKIVGLYGVKGWVKIFSHSRPRETIFKYKYFYTSPDSTNILNLSQGKTQGKGLVACFKEINSRDQAVALLNTPLYINKSQLPPLPNNQFYWHDLLGLQVINRNQLILGKVIDIFETGSNDVLVIQTDQKKELLIPYVIGQYIDKIDLTNKIMTVDWLLEWSFDK